MKIKKSAFTLIELLVVVIIISILAAIALPQYEKAVEKAKAAQALTLLKSVYQAAKVYQMTNGTWPNTLDVLETDIPWTGTERWTGGGYVSQGKSNQDWAIQLFHTNTFGVVVGRISGPYQGAAFMMYKKPRSSSGPEEIPAEELICVEGNIANGIMKPFAKPNGDYCKKIFQGRKISTYHANVYYRLP